MSSKRSTRRSVNPPEEENDPKEVGNEGGLGDVESILNEIEDLVSNVGSDETARPTSVVENQNHSEFEEALDDLETDSVGAVEDIRHLTDELDAAIASELVKNDSKPERQSVPDEDKTDTASIPHADPPTAGDERDGEESETTMERPQEDIEGEIPEAAEAFQPTESEGVPNGVVKVLSAPMEALSSRNRLLVTIFALSMVLWVPLVWTAALMTEPEVPSQAAESLLKTEAPLDQGNPPSNEQ